MHTLSFAQQNFSLFFCLSSLFLFLSISSLPFFYFVHLSRLKRKSFTRFLFPLQVLLLPPPSPLLVWLIRLVLFVWPAIDPYNYSFVYSISPPYSMRTTTKNEWWSVSFRSISLVQFQTNPTTLKFQT